MKYSIAKISPQMWIFKNSDKSQKFLIRHSITKIQGNNGGLPSVYVTKYRVIMLGYLNSYLGLAEG